MCIGVEEILAGTNPRETTFVKSLGMLLRGVAESSAVGPIRSLGGSDPSVPAETAWPECYAA